MSGDRYYITDQHATYFLTFTVVNWMDIFTRPAYKQIITDALNYCIAHKGLKVYAWVLMSNHLHLVAEAVPPFRLSAIIRDFKKYTSKRITDTILQEPESRRIWLLHEFHYEAQRTGRAENYKLWRDDNHAVLLDSDAITKQKIDYIHDNPVRQMIVSDPEHYLHSSAAAYCGSSQQVVDICFYR